MAFEATRTPFRAMAAKSRPRAEHHRAADFQREDASGSARNSGGAATGTWCGGYAAGPAFSWGVSLNMVHPGADRGEKTSSGQPPSESTFGFSGRAMTAMYGLPKSFLMTIISPASFPSIAWPKNCNAYPRMKDPNAHHHASSSR